MGISLFCKSHIIRIDRVIIAFCKKHLLKPINYCSKYMRLDIWKYFSFILYYASFFIPIRPFLLNWWKHVTFAICINYKPKSSYRLPDQERKKLKQKLQNAIESTNCIK